MKCKYCDYRRFGHFEFIDPSDTRLQAHLIKFKQRYGHSLIIDRPVVAYIKHNGWLHFIMRHKTQLPTEKTACTCRKEATIKS